MPQMSPMWWSVMFIFMMIMIMLIVCFLYFFFIPNLSNKLLHPTTSNMYWKWMW